MRTVEKVGRKGGARSYCLLVPRSSPACVFRREPGTGDLVFLSPRFNKQVLKKVWIWKGKYLPLKILLLLDPDRKMARLLPGVFRVVKLLILPRQMVGEIGLQRERKTQFYLHWYAFYRIELIKLLVCVNLFQLDISV